MCTPVAAVLAVTTLATMKMQQNSAKAQAQMYDYQGKVAQTTGALQEDDQRKQADILLGKQRAIFGASGVDPTSGSAADVYSQTAKDAEHNIFQTTFNTSNTVARANQSAANSIYEGNQQAMGTLLNYGSRMAGRYA